MEKQLIDLDLFGCFFICIFSNLFYIFCPTLHSTQKTISFPTKLSCKLILEPAISWTIDETFDIFATMTIELSHGKAIHKVI